MTAPAMHSLKPASCAAAPLRGWHQGSDLYVVTQCTNCPLRELSLPCGLTGLSNNRMEGLVHGHRRVKRGQNLYRAGDTFHSLYAVRGGLFKSSMAREDGLEQVTGFHLMGEVIGMDGIGSGAHASSAIALEDSQVCELPYQHLATFSREIPGLQAHFHRMLGREIVREQSMMLVLGSMRKEQRVAAFLLNLARRLAARGGAANEITLSMTREEIGCYLGMTLETVSRLFSRFRNSGLIDVRQKHVWIRDATGLAMLAGTGLRSRLHGNG